MMSTKMISSKISCWIAAAGLSLCTLGESAPLDPPLPGDPLEMVTGQIQAADTPAARQAAGELLGRARTNLDLRMGRQGYKLDVTFTVNSGGQTQYDGVWKMEDTFDPKQGLRWTANTSAGYTITEISSNGQLYAEGTAGDIPLRLHEARAALFGSLPSSAGVERAGIRTSTATFHSTGVTCVLLSAPGAAEAPGRRWDETEECIDPQSGLLMLQSSVPGRYTAYDYSNAPRLNGRIFPRRVTVTEAGKVVSQISIDSLEQLPAADPSLFIPTQEMKERGRAIAMGEALKISRVVATSPAPTPSGSGAAVVHQVCVFGLVTAAGKLVEAHSLQPSDPYSPAAVEAAQHVNFARPALPGELALPPRQHFAFVIQKFSPTQ
jgi:hypothetical protein